MGDSEGSPEREVHSYIGLPINKEKNSNKQPNPTSTETTEQKQTKPRARKRKEMIDIRAELNEIQTKRTIQRINIYRSWLFEHINKINKPLTRFIKEKKRDDSNK